MLRALSELHRADLASSEGNRADVRKQIRSNLSKIEATEEMLKALAGSGSAMGTSSPSQNPRLGCHSLQQKVRRYSPQPTPQQVRCRKYSSGTQCSTRCGTAESDVLSLRPVSNESKARK